MIVLNVFIDVKPDKEEDFLESINKLITKSRLEKGNISYNMFKQTDEEYQYVTIEYWEDEHALELHNSSVHFNKFSATINDFLVKPMAFKKYLD
ncbi:putative quinol monooxygenase [Bacillus subtilis]|uniref:putative quinol monooxygenase n=1 Tax=Bacillus subtilis TaxID=1423 RepID=UPI0034570727